MSEKIEIAEEILGRIDVYAEKLGIVGSDIYEVILVQQKVDVWIEVVSLFVGFLLLGVLWKGVFVAKKRWTEEIKRPGTYMNDWFWEGTTIALFSISIVVFVFMSLALLFGISDIIGKLTNPQYYAIQEIRELF